MPWPRDLESNKTIRVHIISVRGVHGRAHAHVIVAQPI